jgi:hypothetical protein
MDRYNLNNFRAFSPSTARLRDSVIGARLARTSSAALMCESMCG